MVYQLIGFAASQGAEQDDGEGKGQRRRRECANERHGNNSKKRWPKMHATEVITYCFMNIVHPAMAWFTGKFIAYSE